MEHIGKVIGNLSRGTNTPSQKISKPEPTPTLEEKREELRRSLGVASLDNTFESFKLVPGTKKALSAFKSLASGRTRWKMLLCYGGVGNGKTHLCEAAVITLYKRHLICRVLTMARIMGVLHECIGPERKTAREELLNNYSYADRLIIDDVDGTQWEFDQLEKIIRWRYRERLLTILTTNLDLEKLPVRVVSRFSDPDVGRVVLNEGADYRRLKGEEK